MTKDFPKHRSFPCVKMSVDSIFNIRHSSIAAVYEVSPVNSLCEIMSL